MDCKLMFSYRILRESEFVVANRIKNVSSDCFGFCDFICICARSSVWGSVHYAILYSVAVDPLKAILIIFVAKSKINIMFKGLFPKIIICYWLIPFASYFRLFALTSSALSAVLFALLKRDILHYKFWSII
jgi:hypothetical protein